jgi:hypothetical protein
VTAPAPRDGVEIDALVIDRYLESLLVARAGGADAVPAPADLDPGLRDLADRLVRALPRLHPSFRFEEALSARLATAALARRRPMAAGAEGRVIALPGRLEPFDPLDPELAAYLDRGPLEDDDPARVRPLLIGGALTSAALSLAGAVYVAWRLRRTGSSPMERAARAVAATRLA